MFFCVNATAQTITSVNPNNAAQGKSLTVSITGQNTNFAHGSATTNVWFTQGSSTINASSFSVNNNTLLQADFDIPSAASTGLWDLSVSDEVDGTITLADGFTINPPSLPMTVFIDNTIRFCY